MNKDIYWIYLNTFVYIGIHKWATTTTIAIPISPLGCTMKNVNGYCRK